MSGKNNQDDYEQKESKSVRETVVNAGNTVANVGAGAAKSVINFGTKAKYFGRGILLGIIIAVAGFIAFRVLVLHEALSLTNRGPSGYKVVDVLQESLNDIGELYVMDYNYTIVNETHDVKTLFGKDVPFTGRELKYLYSGDLRVGVDLTTADVKQHGGVITVSFPNMIAHNTFDENSVDFLNNEYLLGNNAIEHYQAMRVESIDDVKKKADEAGTYEKAKENLDMTMNNFLTTAIQSAGADTTYTVEVIIESDEIQYMDS